MILIDSSIWIDYFNGKESPQTDWLHSALGKEGIVVGDLILTEVLQGFQSDKDFKTAKDLLLHFPLFEMLGKDIALESASNYRYLRKRGVTVRKTIDVIIGSFCIHYGFFLLHDDSDFQPMESYLNLKVVPIIR